jgi:hypothetical protein
MKKPIVRYLVILIAILALWETVLLRPIKNFMSFFHKLGHTLTAMICGYGVKDFDESGVALLQVKNWVHKLIIVNGGYLGSILFAVLILSLKRTTFKKYIPGTIAILFLMISIEFSGFGLNLLYSAIFAVFVIALYMMQNDTVNDWVIDIIGISSIAYVVYDTLVNTLLIQLNQQFGIIKSWGTSQPQNDILQMADITHMPVIVWGIIWLILALFAVKLTLLKQSKSRR